MTLPTKTPAEEVMNVLIEHWKFPVDCYEPYFTSIDTLDDCIWSFRTEKYLRETQPNKTKISTFLRQGYYTIKPIIPRAIQIFLRQKMVSQMKKRSVPAWPLDTSVECCICDATLELLAKIPENEFPAISFWPGDYKYAFVITHDVEQMVGCNRVESIAEIELQNGFRSAWYFVPKRYKVDPDLVRQLQQEGFEVGIHGLYHDGKLFRSKKIFIERAKLINQYLAEWQEVGFRSPSLIRNLDWISKYLEIEYDTSAPSTEWFGAQPGGCCTVFPFVFDEIVELPITLQQDHTLLEILKMSPEQMIDQWAQTIQTINNYHGLVLLIFHPDCVNSQDRLQAYEQFLQRMKGETELWHTLPKEVARWWKDRQSSHLIMEDGRWTIQGKAGDRGSIVKVTRDGAEPSGLSIQPYYKEATADYFTR